MKKDLLLNEKTLYLIPVFIWGSTWLVITFQLGKVDPLVSVVYRFFLASLILLFTLKLKGANLKYSVREHSLFILLGLLLFGLNYWVVYVAEEVITSGLVAIIFSSIIFFNSLNGRIFLGLKMKLKVIFGGLLGITGIALIFFNELISLKLNRKTIIAYIISFAGAYMASLGNVLSYYIQKRKIPVLQANGFGMFYGAILMLSLALILGKQVNFDFSFKYIISLLYLSVLGSIVAFTAYLTLVGRIGADKAATVILAAPVFALFLSSIFEGFHWSVNIIIGVALVISGNILALNKSKSKD